MTDAEPLPLYLTQDVLKLYAVKHAKITRRLRVKIRIRGNKIRTLWCGKVIPEFHYWIKYISSSGEIIFVNKYTSTEYKLQLKGIKYD